MADLELFQFKRSHYNEKARWALDYKGLTHRRRSLLPGPHRVTVTRLSGQVQVPVLRDGGRIIAGSAQIIDHLERIAPEPALYPQDADARDRALALQSWFDAEVGPAVRCAAFSDLMADSGYFARVFSDESPPAVRALYRALLPATKALMRRDLDISPETVGPARERVREALERVAEQTRATGYLVGDSFGIADLTAAALLMPAVNPPGGARYPEPLAPVAVRWVARWADHPGSEWVRGIYARHRGVSAEAPA
jgi:glutathione S-transferase